MTIAGILCVIFISLPVLQVYAAWTIDDLVDYWEHIGRGKLWKTTNYVVHKVAWEHIEVEIRTFKHDTQIDYAGSISMYSTEIGGGDRHSCVYLALSLRGQKVGASSITATVKDGGKYSWTKTSTWLTTGLYRIYVHAPSDVSTGSYLVVIEVTKTIDADTYYGTGSYIIECTATTT